MKYIFVLIPFLTGLISFFYSYLRIKNEIKNLEKYDIKFRTKINFFKMSEQNDWNEYKVHVLDSINELKDDFKSFKKEMSNTILEVKENIAKLNIKTSFVAGFFGTLGGSIAVLITLLFK